MNKDRKLLTVLMLWTDVKEAKFLEDRSGWKRGYIIFAPATDEETSARLDKKDRWGQRLNYAYSSSHPEVQAELKELRKTARKLGWTIKKTHKSWHHNGVPQWVLIPADERDKNTMFFRKF